MNYYLEVFKKYSVLKGRASRREYWSFNLINLVIFAAAQLTELLFNDILNSGAKNMNTVLIAMELILSIFLVYILIIFIPSLCVFVRRLHDIGRSGTWFFVAYIPGVCELLIKYQNLSGPLYDFFQFVGIAGLIISLRFTLKSSQLGGNKYGPNPNEFSKPKVE